MTVSVQTPVSTYVANGATTVFPFNFQVLQASDLIVKVAGVQKALGVDYTLAGIGAQAGGTVTFLVAPLTTLIVSIYRQTTLSRSTDYQNNGDFLSPTINADFDRLWMAVQENANTTNARAVRVPAGEVVADLPPAASRAGFILGFDGAGALALVASVAGSATALALSLLGSAGSSLVNFLQAGGGAVLRSIQAKLRDVVSARDFGATGDGVTDDTTSLQSWLNAGGGFLPAGTYKISAALAISVSGTRILGDGATKVQILTNHATADFFTCAAGLIGCVFADFSVWSSGTKSGGAVFTCPAAARFTWRNVVMADRTLVATFGARLFRGIDLQGCDDCTITSACQIAGYTSDAVRVYGSGAFNSELHITGGTRISVANVGVRVAGGFGGILMGDVSIDGCVKDMVIDQTGVATINREVFIESGCVLDACSDTCLEVAANGCSYLEIGAAWIAAAGTYGTPSGNKVGLNVLATNGGLQLKATGSRFFGCVNDGAQLNSLNTAQIIGCDFTSNSRNGLWLAGGASLGGVGIRGGKANGNLTGLQIAAACPAFNIDGFDVSSGNTTPATNASGYSATQSIRDCPGFLTEAVGTAVLLNTTSSIVFNHGLAGTPTAAGIDICPLTSPGATAWYVDATSYTSTQATIRSVAPAGANISFRWHASLNVNP